MRNFVHAYRPFRMEQPSDYKRWNPSSAAFSTDVHELNLHIDGIHVLHNPVAGELFFAIIAERDETTTLLLWLKDQAGHISEASINAVE